MTKEEAIQIGHAMYAYEISEQADIESQNFDDLWQSIYDICQLSHFHILEDLESDELDQAIIAYVKKEFSLMIGERTAEQIKMELGSAYKIDEENASMDIKGRDMITGLPKIVTITESQIREALKEPVYAIIESIKTTLEKTPPELSADIMEKGIMLAGGGALLKGLDKLINHETNMPVHIAETPLDCVVLGAGKALDNFDELSKTQRGQ